MTPPAPAGLFFQIKEGRSEMISHSFSWYACEEHVEHVIDDFIDHCQQAPEVERFNPDRPTPQAIRCRLCGSTPIYQLSAVSE
jgi:CxxH/CxxC protein (TIGR04129 family)